MHSTARVSTSASPGRNSPSPTRRGTCCGCRPQRCRRPSPRCAAAAVGSLWRCSS
ncbi:hypothetical protein [Ornithinimicrobium kibberense]|uniref:hypothetical protein n=1 Tax=Ornithinimicrobium kibberense TaxID=282060 RepID=UPI00360B6CB7